MGLDPLAREELAARDVALARTIPFLVIVTGPSGELQIPMTFKTSSDVGGLP